jgi:hypothetical protein
MNQDIWDEFEKIAVAQGLISVAEEDGQSGTLPRSYDSLSNDAIRLLYNIEPDPEKKKNIIEFAHPETAVVGRAYDAMNAVVENEQQRHDMMTYIALKMPNGQLTQRRYVAAKKELLNSLIRSAFTLDNQDEGNLMALADSCAQRLEENQIKKEAIDPLAVAGIAAAVLGLGYYFFSGAPPAEDVYQNAQKVITALEPLSDRAYAAPIRRDMAVAMSMAKQVYNVKTQLIPIHSVDESISAAQQEDEKKKAEAAHQILSNYMAQLMKIKRAIKGWTSAIRIMASEDTEERGSWSAKLHALTHSFLDTPEETLIYALEGKADVFSAIKQLVPGKQESTSGGLLGAIDQELVKFQGAIDVAKEKTPEIHETLAQAAAKDAQPKPVNTNAPIAENQSKPSMSDLNNELFSTLGLNG